MKITLALIRQKKTGVIGFSPRFSAWTMTLRRCRRLSTLVVNVRREIKLSRRRQTSIALKPCDKFASASLKLSKVAPNLSIRGCSSWAKLHVEMLAMTMPLSIKCLQSIRKIDKTSIHRREGVVIRCQADQAVWIPIIYLSSLWWMAKMDSNRTRTVCQAMIAPRCLSLVLRQSCRAWVAPSTHRRKLQWKIVPEHRSIIRSTKACSKHRQWVLWKLMNSHCLKLSPGKM